MGRPHYEGSLTQSSKAARARNNPFPEKQKQEQKQRKRFKSYHYNYKSWKWTGIHEGFHSLCYLTDFHVSFKLLSMELGAEWWLHIYRALHIEIQFKLKCQLQTQHEHLSSKLKTTLSWSNFDLQSGRQ